MRHRQKKANTVSTPRNVSLTNNALPCCANRGGRIISQYTSASLWKQNSGPAGGVALAFAVAAGENEAAVPLQAHGMVNKKLPI